MSFQEQRMCAFGVDQMWEDTHGRPKVCSCLKELADWGLNPCQVHKMPWRRKQQPTPVCLSGKSHEQRSWGGFHGIRWVSFLWLWFSVCLPSDGEDKQLLEASWWERLTEGKLGLALMSGAMLNTSLIQFSGDGWRCIPSLLFDLRPNIPVEQLQILKHYAVKVLHAICQQIWKTQQGQQDWKRSAFIPIPEKGNAKECSNYCTIALISYPSKVMLKFLQARLQ